MNVGDFAKLLTFTEKIGFSGLLKILQKGLRKLLFLIFYNSNEQIFVYMPRQGINKTLGMLILWYVWKSKTDFH